MLRIRHMLPTSIRHGTFIWRVLFQVFHRVGTLFCVTVCVCVIGKEEYSHESQKYWCISLETRRPQLSEIQITSFIPYN